MDKRVFIYPGQGAHFIGMGQAIYGEYEVARRTFEEANDTLGFDLSRLCFEGSLRDLNRFTNMQHAIVTVSVATYRVYMQEIGIPAAYAAGHSLGEYSALTCAGALSFADALRILQVRGVLAEEIGKTGTGSMTVVNGLSKVTVDEICLAASAVDQVVAAACYNAPDQVVISGHHDAVMRAEDLLLEKGAQITPLLMSPPLHSGLMAAMAPQLKAELQKYSFHPSQWPVIANTTGLPYTDTGQIVDSLTLQISQPVQWQSILDFFEREGATVAIEMGAQGILTNLTEANRKRFRSVSFGQKDDRVAMIREQQEQQQALLHRETLVTRCLAVAVATRNRNWDNEQYRIDVEIPYERIEAMQLELEAAGKLPSTTQKREALEMLRSVFETKKTPRDEQARRFRQLLEELGEQEAFADFLMEAQFS